MKRSCVPTSHSTTSSPSIPQNPIFTAIHNAVAEWLTEQRTTSGRAPHAFRSPIAAHQRIFDAIVSRDPASAQDEMQRHLDEVVKLYWQARTAGS